MAHGSVLSECSDTDMCEAESERALCVQPLPASFITHSSSNKTSTPSQPPHFLPITRALPEVRSEFTLQVDESASVDRRPTGISLRRERAQSSARIPRSSRSCFIVRWDDQDDSEDEPPPRRPSRAGSRFFRRSQEIRNGEMRRVTSRRSINPNDDDDAPSLIRRASRINLRRRLNPSRSLTDATLRPDDDDDDAAEARARAQFARSRNRAVIWGSARSAGSSTIRGDTLEALARALPRAVDVISVARALRTLLSTLPTVDALARAAQLAAGAAANPPTTPCTAPWPTGDSCPPRALAAHLPFGDALVLVIAVAAPVACISVRRRARVRSHVRLSCSLVLRSQEAAARVDVSERAKDVVDIAISPGAPTAPFATSRRRDATTALIARFATAWHDSELATYEQPLAVRTLSSNSSLSWRRQITFSVHR